MTKKKRLHILGGGPAGLSVGFFAQKKGISFQILEATSNIGGNAVTFSREIQGQTFRYDSGAHRFHNKSEIATATVQALLGENLLKTEAKSQIFIQDTFIDFPLDPLGLIKYFGTATFLKAGAEVINNRIRNRKQTFPHFKSFAAYKYGDLISQHFLFDYSQKLWGRTPEELSEKIAGIRLDGLTLRRFLAEGVLGIKSRNTSFASSHFYPKFGYGMIADALAKSCSKNIAKEHVKNNL